MGYRKVGYLEQCWYILKWKRRNRKRERREKIIARKKGVVKE